MDVRVNSRGIWNVLIALEIAGEIETPLLLPESLYGQRTFVLDGLPIFLTNGASRWSSAKKKILSYYNKPIRSLRLIQRFQTGLLPVVTCWIFESKQRFAFVFLCSVIGQYNVTFPQFYCPITCNFNDNYDLFACSYACCFHWTEK